MTAPGQEPDEVTTAKPGGEDDAERAEKARAELDEEANLNKIGDNHMPEDLRETERDSHHDPQESR